LQINDRYHQYWGSFGLLIIVNYKQDFDEIQLDLAEITIYSVYHQGGVEGGATD